ncbi:MAG: T9SS type A sorting domain-containing protein [Candidatus Stahlbacteria bacterium]|nr:T9SS type A sorting domain-containing protein [Candidatus Stahlbacteria bacterium]
MFKGIVSLFVPMFLLAGTQQEEVKILRWSGPPGSKPGTFKEWNSAHPYSTNFYCKLSQKIVGKQKGGKVAILIDSTIADNIATEIGQLMTDLQSEGYTVSAYKIAGGTPQNLRSFLQNLYATDNIEGVLFVGDLPVAWFQIGNDFEDYGGYGYAEWPIDLFYMDLNGNWLDTLRHEGDTLIPGQDSIYDAHSGTISPEIYIGRLTPQTGNSNAIGEIKNYFSKDHSYRQHTIELTHRALVYVDDDWEPSAHFWAEDVSILYPDTLVVADPNTTRASDYRVRLDTIRAWVSVFAHSWPGGHIFDYNNHNDYDYYYSSEYVTQDPPANFYNHFACSYARYTEYEYGGGRAIFNQSYGVGAIGSTKSGSMLEFSYFYQPLSQGKTIGTAFKEWFTYITADTVTSYELSWHYGMTLLGDPFLKPIGHIAVEETYKTPTTMFISQNYPNPFTKSTTIDIRLGKKSQQVKEPSSGLRSPSLIIYDLAGRVVKTWDLGIGNCDFHKVVWDGRDAYGNKLASGIYFVKLKIGERALSKKMYLLKD